MEEWCSSWAYFGERRPTTHASTKREPQGHFRYSRTYGPEVVRDIIAFEHEGLVHRWDYQVPEDARGRSLPQLFYRVFVEKDQGLELDIEQSLDAMGQAEGAPTTPQYRDRLQSEASVDNIPNQVVLQVMYERLQSGLPMLPGASLERYSPVNATTKKPQQQ